MKSLRSRFVKPINTATIKRKYKNFFIKRNFDNY
jgi:hypothetical protein